MAATLKAYFFSSPPALRIDLSSLSLSCNGSSWVWTPLTGWNFYDKCLCKGGNGAPNLHTLNTFFSRTSTGNLL